MLPWLMVDNMFLNTDVQCGVNSPVLVDYVFANMTLGLRSVHRFNYFATLTDWTQDNLTQIILHLLYTVK